MDDMHPGYGQEVDLWVFFIVLVKLQPVCLSIDLILTDMLWRFRGIKVGLWCDPVHVTGWLAAVLASQTDADAEDDHGGSISVQFSRVGRPIWHCQRSGQFFLLGIFNFVEMFDHILITFSCFELTVSLILHCILIVLIIF